MKFEISKNYLLSLRYYLLFAALLFIFSVGIGYSFAKTSPAEVKEILEQVQIMLEPFREMSEIRQVLFIFLNNTLTGFFAILLGAIFGIVPFIVLFANGEILGVMIYLSREALPLSVFFTGILPHGVIEIPVLIFCGAIGLKIGALLIKKIFKKQVEIKKELIFGLKFFFLVLIPLLLLASIIEVFITQKLLSV